jgi:tight adherence protein B
MTPDVLRAALLVAVFVAVLFTVEFFYVYVRDIQGARKRVNRRLELLDAGYDRSEVLELLRRRPAGGSAPGMSSRVLEGFDLKLGQAGLRITAPKFLGLIAVGFVVMLGVGTYIGSDFGMLSSPSGALLVFVFAGGTSIGLPILALGRLRDRRIKKLEAQFPTALDVFVRGLRAGHPISSALDLLTKELPDPIGSEFGIVADEITYGLDLKEALGNMAQRLKLADVDMFVVCVSVQSETGGNLSEVLANLNQVIRDRHSMVLKVRALSSEGRMSARMLTALPIFGFASTFSSKPEYYMDVAGDPLFLPLFGGVIALFFIGITIMNKITDLKV